MFMEWKTGAALYDMKYSGFCLLVIDRDNIFLEYYTYLVADFLQRFYIGFNVVFLRYR